jgi:hypothetical protein
MRFFGQLFQHIHKMVETFPELLLGFLQGMDLPFGLQDPLTPLFYIATLFFLAILTPRQW